MITHHHARSLLIENVFFVRRGIFLNQTLTGCVLFFAFIPVSHAQDIQIISKPEIGKENTVPAGEELYSFNRLYTVEGYQLDASTKAGNWLLETPVEAGTRLIPVSTTKAAKACVPQLGTFTPVGPCFIDDNGDGLFDRHSADEVTMFRKLKPPVPYSRTSLIVTREDNFKKIFLFQGATVDTLRFSYREFRNDLARPAFTEELSILREPFPAMIMLKNLQIEILNVSGMGLSYRVIKVN